MTTFSGIDHITVYDGTPRSLVKPAKLAHVAAHDGEDATANALRGLLRNACKYNVSRLDNMPGYFIGNVNGTNQASNEYGARAACEAVYGISVCSALGAWDETACGMTEATAVGKCATVIAALCTQYESYAAWAYTWQAASWAALLAKAVWLLWDDLPWATQRRASAVVEAEATRILAYTTEYWNGTDDTPGETVAWNATILQAARAMMPQHPSAASWRAKEIELELAANSRPSDMTSETVIDGTAVGSWIDGYNVAEDGMVINHGIVHPDYMQAIIMFLQQAKVTYLLSDASESASCDFRCEDQWQVLTAKNWATPAYDSPGGTVYAQDGSYHLYYPEGNDWAENDIRQDIYLLADVFALKAGWDSTVTETAADWVAARIAQLQTMHARHEDGHLYADGEFDWGPKETFAGWMFADAYLSYRGAA